MAVVPRKQGETSEAWPPDPDELTCSDLALTNYLPRCITPLARFLYPLGCSARMSTMAFDLYPPAGCTQ